MDVPDPLRLINERLEALADLYERACAAIDAHNSVLGQELTRESKLLHASVNELNAAQRAAPPPGIRPEHVARMRVATSRVQAGNLALQTRLESATSAQESVRSRLPENWDFEVDILLVEGRGCAHLVHQLIALGQMRLFLYLPGDGEVEDVDPGATILRTIPEFAVAISTLQGLAPRSRTRWRLNDPAVTEELHEEAGRVFGREVQKLATAKATVDLMGPLWALQGAANLANVASLPSISALRDAFRGKPCLLVSPGPSLDKNIHLVAAVRDRVLVVTSSHTLSALSKAGVVPDVCITLDAQDLRYHFDDAPMDQINLLLAATVHPDLYSLPARRIVTFGGNSETDRWIYDELGDHGLLSAGGSVACTALDLAAEWGCDPIILIGQDLAFSGDRYYSALSADGGLKIDASEDGRRFGFGRLSDGLTNIVEKAKGQPTSMAFVEAPGYHGGTVRTSVSFEVFRTWMTCFVQADRRGLRFLNCTEGGAFIEGMEHVPLATAIERHLRDPIPVEATLASRLAGVDIPGRQHRMLKRMQKMGKGIADCSRLAADCVRIARQAQRSPSLVKSLGKSERRLLSALQPILFLSQMRQVEINTTIARARRATSLSQSLDASLELYEVVRSACELLGPVISQGITELEAKMARA